MAKVYLSYRRYDAAAHAGRLYDRLAVAFGRATVLKDIDPPLGSRAEWLRETISTLGAMLVIIGPDWLRDESRHDVTDKVRLEIAVALQHKIRVIPVLVGDAVMPSRESLPGDISDLARRQAIEISDSRYDHDVERLTEALKQILQSSERPSDSASATRATPAQFGPGGPTGSPPPARSPVPVETPTPETRDIFISHIEEDGVTASALAENLRAHGHSTWMYEEDGMPGVSYLTQIDTAIGGCRGVVIIASAKAVAAHEVIREVEAAHQRAKMIIPIRIGLTHQQFTDANPILRMATGTAVSIAMREGDVANVAKRIVQALRVGSGKV